MTLALTSAPAATPASEALAILQKHCAPCHGTKGEGEGGFDYVTDLAALTSGKRPKVVAGDANSSRLYQRIVKKQMPPPEDGDSLTADEIKTLYQWIQEGAHREGAPSADPISDEELLSAIERDLAATPAPRQRHLRYLSFQPWQNAGATSVVDKLPGAVNKALNSLTWAAAPVVIRRVNPILFALDLDAIGWDPSQWEIAVDQYPYLGAYAGPVFQSLQKTTGTQLPVVRGDWLIREITRAPKYFFLLQLPENLGALAASLKSHGGEIDFQADIEAGDIARSGFNASGVALNKNRIVERHAFEYRLPGQPRRKAYFWRSYDTKITTGRGNYFAFPLTIFENPDYAFSYDGGEMIFSLPNGMQAYYLANARDNRVDEGAIDLVSGTRARPVIVNGISCMDCHRGGLIVKRDEIRDHVLGSPFPKSVQDKVAAAYPVASEMDRLFEKDIDQHLTALKAIGVSEAVPDPVGALVSAYEADLTPAQTAAEAGETLDDFLNAIRRSPFSKGTVGGVLSGGNVSRTAWEDQFAKVSAYLRKNLR